MKRLQLGFALLAALVGCDDDKRATETQPIIADAGKRDAAAPSPPKSGAGGSSGKSAKPDAGAAGESSPSAGGAGGKDVGPVAAIGGGGGGGGGVSGGGAAGDDADSGVPVMPRTDYAAIADEACEMTGGQCVPQGDCSHETDGRLQQVCRPGVPGIVCCRKGATECVTPRLVCCDVVDDKYRSTGTTCDRGYQTCSLVKAGEKWLATDKTCETRVDETGPDAPNQWPDTVSAVEAGRWACMQAGGITLQRGEACPDRSFGQALDATHPCCLPAAVCPEVNVGTECCTPSGTVQAKMCMDGRAMCPTPLIAMGIMKEVPVGTCEPFTPESP
jgi:hypothetical protein